MGYLLFDPIVKHIILKKLVLTDSSDFAQLWKEPPITPHLKVGSRVKETNGKMSKGFYFVKERKSKCFNYSGRLLCLSKSPKWLIVFFLFQIYFFNLTNAEAVFEGLEKPKLEEVGPYVYQ